MAKRIIALIMSNGGFYDVKESIVYQVKKARHATYIGEWLAKILGCL